MDLVFVCAASLPGFCWANSFCESLRPKTARANYRFLAVLSHVQARSDKICSKIDSTWISEIEHATKVGHIFLMFLQCSWASSRAGLKHAELDAVSGAGWTIKADRIVFQAVVVRLASSSGISLSWVLVSRECSMSWFWVPLEYTSCSNIGSSGQI